MTNRPGESLTTPVNSPDGNPFPAPARWIGENRPASSTDPADVTISKDMEIKSFHVAVRMRDNGGTVSSTDASTRRIRAAVAKAGAGVYYKFDNGTQEAVIIKPESQVPLLGWLATQEGMQ